ncbi:hypothetical protein [Acetobacter papayae]|nr:hypothetical protein [Acetobacter papayae]
MPSLSGLMEPPCRTRTLFSYQKAPPSPMQNYALAHTLSRTAPP